jgi:hypothetical protein
MPHGGNVEGVVRVLGRIYRRVVGVVDGAGNLVARGVV